MSDRYFLDTNIFVYSFDNKDKGKQETAREVIENALKDQMGIISTQVIGEFFNVATRKFERKMKIEECQAYLETVFTPLCEVFPSCNLYARALDIGQETSYAFYDSLIIAAALESGCKVIYSEDLQDGQIIGETKIVNPFAGTG